MRQTVFDSRYIGHFFAISPEAIATNFERLTGFLQCFLKITSDTHGFAYGFHLQAQRTVGTGEFIKIPTRYFYDNVVDSRLKKRGSTSRNRVDEFI